MTIIDTLRSELDVILTAPFSVGTLMAASAVISWIVRSYLANNKAEAQNERIEMLKDQLGAKSDKELLEKVNRLQERIDAMKVSDFDFTTLISD